jgi:hypothetical protein
MRQNYLAPIDIFSHGIFGILILIIQRLFQLSCMHIDIKTYACPLLPSEDQPGDTPDVTVKVQPEGAYKHDSPRHN